jgi:hypothetical protein
VPCFASYYSRKVVTASGEDIVETSKACLRSLEIYPVIQADIRGKVRASLDAEELKAIAKAVCDELETRRILGETKAIYDDHSPVLLE